MLRLSIDPLTTTPEVRIGGCGVWETVASLAVLARFRVRGAGIYARWAHEMQSVVAPDMVRELWPRVSQVSPPPPGPGPEPDFEAAFADPELVRLLRQYWTTALEPYWSGMAETLRAEEQRRRQTLISRGWVTMLGGIDARLRWRPPHLASPHHDEIRHVAKGRHLTLVPMVFGGAWTLFTALPSGTTSLSYALPAAQALRGLPGRPVGTREHTDPLTVLLGPRRASILRCLQRPCTTTTLAATLGIAPSTASEHLHALLAAGAVRSNRRGNEVFYELDQGGFTLMATFT